MLLARAARSRGVSVTAVGVRGVTNPELASEVDHIHWIEFGQINRLIKACHESNVERVMLAGRIQHNSLFQLSHMDMRGVKLVARTKPRTADALLGSFTEELARENIEVMDSTMFLHECMPPSGLLTPGCPLDEEQQADLEFGRPLARSIAGHDIGQTIVVKQQTIVAVEAMEGTNLCILRAGEIGGPGCMVIKIQKPRQDRRFDVPVVGLTTIRKMVQAGATALCIPGEQVLFFDQKEACELAAEHGISIHAW